MSQEKQIKVLQAQFGSLVALTKSLIVNLKRESSRMFNVVNLYKTHRMKDCLYSHPDLKDTQFKDLEDYSELLLRQFSPRLEELLKQSTSQKIALEKLQKEFASKPTQSYAPRITAFRQYIKQLEGSIEAIWCKQHFLALNYRLDISAKQLQRWTAVMTAYAPSSQEVIATIQALFK